MPCSAHPEPVRARCANCPIPRSQGGHSESLAADGAVVLSLSLARVARGVARNTKPLPTTFHTLAQVAPLGAGHQPTAGLSRNLRVAVLVSALQAVVARWAVAGVARVAAGEAGVCGAVWVCAGRAVFEAGAVEDVEGVEAFRAVAARRTDFAVLGAFQAVSVVAPVKAFRTVLETLSFEEYIVVLALSAPILVDSGAVQAVLIALYQWQGKYFCKLLRPLNNP